MLHSVSKFSKKETNEFRFIPERFLNGRSELKSNIAAFGGGSRICLGIHLAYMELRHGTAWFFRECTGAKLAPLMTDDMMAVKHFFLIAPAAQACHIIR